MSITAMKQALEALEYAQTGNRRPEVIGTAITALRTAIAAAEKQEPVAWMYQWKTGAYRTRHVSTARWPESSEWTEWPLYTHPPQRKPLTDEEIALIVGECAASAHRHDDFSFARAIERAHGIGGEA